MSDRLAMAILAAALGACATADAGGTEYKLYYLGGQSNMEGFGYVEELPAAVASTSDNVMIFTGQMALDNETHAGVGIWQPLQPGSLR